MWSGRRNRDRIAVPDQPSTYARPWRNAEVKPSNGTDRFPPPRRNGRPKPPVKRRAHTDDRGDSGRRRPESWPAHRPSFSTWGACGCPSASLQSGAAVASHNTGVSDGPRSGMRTPPASCIPKPPPCAPPPPPPRCPPPFPPPPCCAYAGTTHISESARSPVIVFMISILETGGSPAPCRLPS